MIIQKRSKRPKKIQSNKYKTSFYSRYKITPEDLSAFVLCSAATFALNFFIISVVIYKKIITGLPNGVGLIINASDIFLGQYETFFRLEYPFVWLIFSLAIATSLRLIDKIDINNKKTLKRIIIYSILLFTSGFYSIVTNEFLFFLFIFIIGLCICATQFCSNFLTSLAIVNFLIFTTTTLYVTRTEDNQNKSSYTHILIDTNGSYVDYKLIVNSKKGALVQNASNNTLLIPSDKINKYKFDN